MQEINDDNNKKGRRTYNLFIIEPKKGTEHDKINVKQQTV